MEFELGQLADLIGGELTDPTQAGVKVSGVRSLDAAGPGDLAFLWDDKYLAAARTSKASAVSPWLLKLCACKVPKWPPVVVLDAVCMLTR